MVMVQVRTAEQSERVFEIVNSFSEVRKMSKCSSRSFLVLVLGQFLFGTVALADEYKNFEKKYDVPQVGQVRLAYKITGEPVAAPSHVEVWVRCKGAKSDKLIEKVGMCDLKKYDYDSIGKVLSLSYSFARVDHSSGTAKCDGSDQREIKISRVCRKDYKSEKQ